MTPDLLNHLPYAVLLLTRDLRVTYANTTAEAMLGESLSYLRKRKFADIFHPSNELVALINSAFAGDKSLKEYGFTLSGHRVGTLVVALHLVPMGEEMLMCFDDTGAAQTLGNSLQQRQNARAQNNMAAILAHEVKNPLAGIKGAAQLLQKTVKASDRELTALICNEVDRIKGVVEEMEFFSNPTELKTETLNIHEVLHYARALIEKSTKRKIKFTEHFDPSLPLISGHRNLLVQAFINLLKNAEEASDNTIITMRSAYHSGVRLRRENAGAVKPLPVLITIEDNGPGIPADLRASIFEPFITTKEQGKGLGLAIVAKIIADHGGVIELDAFAEQGACFNILLPAI